MKNIIACLSKAILGFSFLFSSLQGEEKSKNKTSLEIKPGYFTFASSTMRKIYNEGGADVQFSASIPIIDHLKGYISVEYNERQGFSLQDHQRTRIWQVPVSLGLKPYWKIASFLEYYFTVGPRVFALRQTNDSSYVPKHIWDGGIGAFANTGFNFLFCEGKFFIDLVGEYSYEKIHHHFRNQRVFGSSRQVGGYSGQIGVGFNF